MRPPALRLDHDVLQSGACYGTWGLLIHSIRRQPKSRLGKRHKPTLTFVVLNTVVTEMDSQQIITFVLLSFETQSGLADVFCSIGCLEIQLKGN